MSSFAVKISYLRMAKANDRHFLTIYGYRDRLFSETQTADKAVGRLTQEWADILGLTTDVVVGVSEFDCHMGAIGANIKEHTFVRIIGTSTCDIMVASKEEIGDKLIKGICGQVDGSVIPGMISTPVYR